MTGHKRLFTALDLATIALLLVILSATNRPLQQVLIYAWNPAVLIALSLSGHNDYAGHRDVARGDHSLNYRPSGHPVNRDSGPRGDVQTLPGLPSASFPEAVRWSFTGIFASVMLLVYLPFAGAGRHFFVGLSDFAAQWGGNYSLYRLFIAARNSSRQAQLVSGIFLLLLTTYVLKTRMDIFQVALVTLGGLLLLSLKAFPWYFTWIAPFLCFCPSPALLLLTVTCVLGYAPVIAYAAGGHFSNSPLMQFLEYFPPIALLGYEVARHFQCR